DAPDTEAVLQGMQQFNPKLQQFETRVLPLSSTPLKRHFSMADPVVWGELCLANPSSVPTFPAPSYISLIAGKKEDLACVAACKDTDACPEIVLIDQSVAHHPDIAQALGIMPEPGTPQWCPFAPFDPDKHHGTHMAGLMVSSGATSGFSAFA